MNRSSITYLIPLILLIAVCAPEPASAQEYRWPTDASRHLSSTFGETRSAHFHAGLDIKTWGAEGYKVFAARKGIVHRILITERGYGRALYLKHPDNTYTVYAHMQRFNPELQQLADSLRMADNYASELDINAENLNISVEQGDIIGYSGSTGIGPPHLHFEIRDSLQNPVNALTHQFTIKDTRPPRFGGLVAEPLGPESRIEGAAKSGWFRSRKRSDGVFDYGEISIRGKAGLAVNAYDKANGVYNSYAVYAITLVHKSDTLYHEKMNSYSYEDASEMFLNRIAPFGKGSRGYQRLYDYEPGNNPFQIVAKPGAKIPAPDSTAEYRIIAEDYFGNKSEALIRVKRDTSAIRKDPDITSDPSGWYWTADWVSPDHSGVLNLENPEFGHEFGNGNRILFRNEENLEPLIFARVSPGEVKTVESPDKNLKLHFSGNEFFDTVSVVSGYHWEDSTAVISVQPAMLPSKGAIELEFYMEHLNPSENDFQLYARYGNNRYSYASSSVRGRVMKAWITPGEYVILSDTTAPHMNRFRIERTTYGRWVARVHTDDELSGVNSSSAEFYVNGERGITEYDYEKEILTYYLPGFIPGRHNTARVIIKDRAGNETSKEFTYTLSDPVFTY